MLDAYWYIACESQELRQRAIAVTILQTFLVVFRGADGRAVALADRCVHRNAPLSQGKVCRGELRCPYHGWHYGADGGVTLIPALPEGAPIPDGLAAKSYPCIEQDGYVWVCLQDAPAMPQPPHFPYLGEPGWVHFRMKTRFHAAVETCLENFLDCPHATYVHQYWFRTPTFKPVKAIVSTLPDGAVAEYFEEPREASLVWWLLSRKRSQMKHCDRFIAPATSRVDYQFSDQRHYIIMSACTPISDTETEVYTVINFKVPWGRLVRLFFAPLSRRIIQQDVEILNQQQANVDRFGQPCYRFIPADLLAPYIRKWRHAIQTQTAPPPAGIEHQVEMRL
ncbi:MAG: aromatic ring-hydroxylating dioxygenase subunit alpha [Synechococcales bacterium]|nr:aromatic ring-hydroxylating dioxygenase subunit alpha [Synechococcales bacterium]